MKKILVICTGNSCRSQMAEGYLEQMLEGKAEVYSAGLEAHGLNPWAVRVMQQTDIDITHHTSNVIDDYVKMDFDFVITVFDHAKENSPVFPSSAIQIHRDFPDPAKSDGSPAELEKIYSDVRDMIAEFSERFVNKYFEPVNSST